MTKLTEREELAKCIYEAIQSSRTSSPSSLEFNWVPPKWEDLGDKNQPGTISTHDYYLAADTVLKAGYSKPKGKPNE